MDIATRPEKNDRTIMQDGLSFFLERDADRLLANATIDYVDRQGFVISGLHRSSCCG